MKKWLRFYELANILSLDVTVGAVVSAFFFARILRVSASPWDYSSLGVTVWIIYTADHLLDARRLNSPASSGRHRFHQEYFKDLRFALLFAGVLDAILVCFLEKPVIMTGMVLGIVAIVYLLIQQKLKSFKELSGTFLYCSGISVPALSIMDNSITASQGLLVVQFGITVLSNLLLFSLFDLDDDLHDKHQSFVTVMGVRRTRALMRFLFGLNGLFIVYQLINFSAAAEHALTLLVMNGILFLIFLYPGKFRTAGFYRLLGDAVFLIPLLFLLF